MAPGWRCLDKYVALDAGIGLLIDSPAFLTPADWGTVQIADTEVVPASSYVVQADYGDTGAAVLSTGVSATTWAWGDANGSGAPVDLIDIVCVLDGFAGGFGACSLWGVDQAGCAPDGIIDLADIVAVLGAFAQEPFSCDNPCP